MNTIEKSVSRLSRDFSRSFNRTASSIGVAHNKYVLYIILVIAIFNAISFVAWGNYVALSVFLFVAMMMSWFVTRNMILVLLTAILITHLLIRTHTIEGMENKEEEEEEEDDEVDGVARIDEKATKMKSLETMKNVLGQDGIDNMVADTDNLVKSQEQLMKTIETMSPIMDKLDKMIGSIQNMKVPSLFSK
jgi:hypothetical protein